MKYINNWDWGSVSVSWRCRVSASVCVTWCGGNTDVGWVVWCRHLRWSTPLTSAQLPLANPHTCAPTHTRTHTLRSSLSHCHSPLELACSDDENTSQIAVRAESLRPTCRHTVKDQSEDIEWLHDPSTSTVTSTIEYKTFILLRWQVKLQFIYNPDTKALKCDKCKKGDKKTFEAQILKKEKIQSTLLGKRLKFLL